MEYLTPADLTIAESNGIPEHRAKYRFYTLGWSKRRAITQECKQHKGLWPKWKETCTVNGVTQSTFFRRMNESGLTPEQAATIPPQGRGHKFKRNHKLTPEIYEIAEKNGISKGTLKQRVYYYKWSVERASTEPIHTTYRKKGWK